MTTPNRAGASAESGYTAAEIAYWDARIAVLEKLLEVDTNFAGLGLIGRLSPLSGAGALASTETLTGAGAVSVSKLQTILDGTTSAFAATLAAPTADGQVKIIKLGVSSAHSPTLDGANIVTAAGVSQAGKTAPFTSIAAGSVSFLILLSVGGVWVTIGGNVTFA